MQPPLFLRWGIDLTKNPKKGGGMEKLLKGRGILRSGGFCRKGDAISLGIFSNWNMANVLTFNYILVIVFLFPLNAVFSPCFHCTGLVHVYRVHTFCFHNTVVSSCYRLHTSCLHHTGATSCFSLNMWL